VDNRRSIQPTQYLALFFFPHTQEGVSPKNIGEVYLLRQMLRWDYPTRVLVGWGLGHSSILCIELFGSEVKLDGGD
jgi:hypothetical protein